MGVQVAEGKGRGKSLMVDLNLVPFIDFLSCLIAFLMITAVWTQIHSLDVEQNIAPPDPNVIIPDPPPPPPLTVHVEGDRHWIGRKVETATTIMKVGETYDYEKLREIMKKDREEFPDERLIVINTDDGVAYEEMIKVLDMSREPEMGYEQTALAGGAPAPDPVAPGAALPPG
jgi:biopolymer transport protein ExbD